MPPRDKLLKQVLSHSTADMLQPMTDEDDAVSHIDAERPRRCRLESLGSWLNFVVLPLVVGIGAGIVYQNRDAIGEFSQANRQRVSSPADLMLWMGGSEKSTQDLFQQIPHLIQRNNQGWQQNLDSSKGASQRYHQAVRELQQQSRFPVAPQQQQSRTPSR